MEREWGTAGSESVREDAKRVIGMQDTCPVRLFRFRRRRVRTAYHARKLLAMEKSELPSIVTTTGHQLFGRVATSRQCPGPLP